MGHDYFQSAHTRAVRGIKVSDLEALDAEGIDRSALALRSTKAMAKMVFEDGFFHADPHPGNLVPVGAVVRELTTTMRRNRLQLPHELALLLRMLVMAEGMGAMLDPEFQFAAVIGPYAEALARERFTPGAIGQRLAGAGGKLLDAAAHLPQQLRALQDALGRGGPELTLRAEDLDRLTAHVDAAAQRIVAATLAAAFIRGIGEIVAAEPQGRARALRSALVTAGFASAASLAGYLAWTGRPRRRL